MLVPKIQVGEIENKFNWSCSLNGFRIASLVFSQFSGFLFVHRDPPDVQSQAGLFIDINQCCREDWILVRNLECPGLERDGRFQDALNVSPDNAIVRSGHANIALKSSSAGQDLFIGCGDMRMCPNDCRDFSIKVAADQLLITGCFGVKIQKADFDSFRNFIENTICCSKGAIDGSHKNPAQQAEYGNLDPLLGLGNRPRLSGRLGREIGWFDYSVIAFKCAKDYTLFVDVVTECYDVDAVIAEFLERPGF